MEPVSYNESGLNAPPKRKSRLRVFAERLYRHWFLISLAGVLIANGMIYCNVPYATWALNVTSMSFAVAMFIAVVNMLYKDIVNFLLLQKRTAELMATVFFGCFIAAVANKLQKNHDEITTVWYVAGAMIWAFAGSSWAWNRLRVLNEQNPGRRLLFLLKGWMLIPGLLALVCFICAIIAVVAYVYSFIRDSSEYNADIMRTITYSIVSSAFASLFAWPGIALEWRLRKGTYRRQPRGSL